MPDRIGLCQEMAIVRNRGLVNAVDLGHEVERLGDWREHVRAYPIPAAVLAAAAGYWLIPVRAKRTGYQVSVAPETPFSSAKPEGGQDGKSSGLAGLGGAALGLVGSLIGNAVRGYVAEQFQTLIQTRGSHAPQDQRQAPIFRS